MSVSIKVKYGRPAKNVGRPLEQDKMRQLVAQILIEEAARIKMGVEEMLAADRHYDTFQARKQAMIRMRELGLSSMDIAIVTNRHHTTVLNALGLLSKQQPEKLLEKKRIRLTTNRSYAPLVEYGTERSHRRTGS